MKKILIWFGGIVILGACFYLIMKDIKSNEIDFEYVFNECNNRYSYIDSMNCTAFPLSKDPAYLTKLDKYAKDGNLFALDFQKNCSDDMECAKIQADKGSPRWQYEYADFLYKAEKYDDAEKYYLMAVKNDKLRPYRKLIDLYIETEKYDKMCEIAIQGYYDIYNIQVFYPYFAVKHDNLKVIQNKCKLFSELDFSNGDNPLDLMPVGEEYRILLKTALIAKTDATAAKEVYEKLVSSKDDVISANANLCLSLMYNAGRDGVSQDKELAEKYAYAAFEKGLGMAYLSITGKVEFTKQKRDTYYAGNICY